MPVSAGPASRSPRSLDIRPGTQADGQPGDDAVGRADRSRPSPPLDPSLYGPHQVPELLRPGGRRSHFGASGARPYDAAMPDAPPIAATDEQLATVKFDADGLVPAIVQEEGTGQVLMMAYMNAETLRMSLEEGRTVFWSRSRQEVWRKGDTSGHVQYVRGVTMDCDGDTLLVRVEQVGAACHTGTRTCFTGRALPAFDGLSER
mgnify:CR=1 FL=1